MRCIITAFKMHPYQQFRDSFDALKLMKLTLPLGFLPLPLSLTLVPLLLHKHLLNPFCLAQPREVSSSIQDCTFSVLLALPSNQLRDHLLQKYKFCRGGILHLHSINLDKNVWVTLSYQISDALESDYILLEVEQYSQNHDRSAQAETPHH